MRATVAPLAMMLVAACGGDSGGNPDAAIDAAVLTCTELRDALRMKIDTVSHACEVDFDCGVVGVAQNANGHTCDCAPAFGRDCSGDVVNVEAWRGDPRITELVSEWDLRCRPSGCGVAPCACDCGIGQVNCVNNVCRTTSESCLGD